MQFIPSLRYGSIECRTLAVPVHYSHLPLVELIKTGEDDSLTMPTYKSDNDFFSMVHTALKIQADLLNMPGHDGFNISENEAIDCIPHSLYMFL